MDTLDGEVEVDVPPGTQNNDKLTLEKAGIWPFNPPDNYDPYDLRGNHVITFEVQLPRKGEFSEEQQASFRKYAEWEAEHREELYPHLYNKK